MTAPQTSPSSSIRFGQPSGPGAGSPGFGWGGALAGVAVVAIVLGGLVWSAAAGKTAKAQQPDLFGGSLVLEDSRPLPVVDVATAQVTVRLQGVDAQVGATTYSEVEAVPVTGGTMLVNRVTGTFNLLGNDDYVLDPDGAGIGLGSLPGSNSASALPAGPGAYVVRSGPSHTTVSLVDQATVSAAARAETSGAPASASAAGAQGVTAAPAAAVAPRGFAALGGLVSSTQAGAEAVQGTDLLVLLTSGGTCSVERLHPVARGHNGLVASTVGSLASACSGAAVEGAGADAAAVSPGQVILYTAGGPNRGDVVRLPATAGDNEFLPVAGATGTLWFLARSLQGWSVFGVDPDGKTLGPSRLASLGPNTQPAVPALSGGLLYTLDQNASEPELWTIVPATGGMAPLAGRQTYPVLPADGKASFQGVQVLVDGPRIVFNNPQTLEAVVVFPGTSRPPAVINKSDAVDVSATGPADLDVTATESGAKSKESARSSGSKPVPVDQPVNPLISCAHSTEKPYAPQITSVTPSSSSALVAWSYQLLDQTDCEPDSWSVDITALSGSHQPAPSLRVVNGQTQYLFTGLRPTTNYQVVVTAYINTESTASVAVPFTTSARGPDAPTSVTTTSDGNGDWVVSWTPCTSTSCVVPADTWNVVGTACGASFVGTPPTVQVPASQTSVTVNAESLGLLGDSMSFSVDGSLVSGLTGTSTSDHNCTEAWRSPDAAAISLADAGAANGATITATLQVETTGPPIEAFGSQDTEFTYSVGGQTIGPTTATSVQVPGLAPGAQYTPTVAVTPVGHPSATLTVTGPPFSQTVSWPTNLSIGVVPTVDTNPDTGTLAVSFPNAPSGPLTAAGTLQCGGSGGETASVGGPVTNGGLTYSMNLEQMGGACTLDEILSDTANPDPYGTTSQRLSASFSIGTVPTYTFAAEWGTPVCNGVLCVTHRYPIHVSAQPPAPDLGTDWTVTAQGSLGPACTFHSSPTPQPAFPVTVYVNELCHLTPITVTVSYLYLGQTNPVPAPLSGSPCGTTMSTTSTTTCTASSPASAVLASASDATQVPPAPGDPIRARARRQTTTS